ncbi:MAG: DUF5615 family PIN-like protein [Saprospiraceae bacterium]|nr:DUF5615 family PIN-like protein [Flavobacteriales bacterium]MCB0574147.1 DUF5615 family PIN-like protein [Saprospiraceae bacterium]MCB9353401.1 DUF5615 family PIN-like protein [Lewinellaceae bacterium]
MKFLADEGVDRSLVMMIRKAGHDVSYIAEDIQSTDDEAILEIANREYRILITRDKDFGELVYRMKRIHSGILLIRAEELSSTTRSQMVSDFITENSRLLEGNFIVIQAGAARLRKLG